MSQAISNVSPPYWPEHIKTEWLPEDLHSRVGKLIANQKHWYEQVPIAREAFKFGITKAQQGLEKSPEVIDEVVENLGNAYTVIKTKLVSSASFDFEYATKVSAAIEETVSDCVVMERLFADLSDVGPVFQERFELLQQRLDPILQEVFKDLTEEGIPDLFYQIARDIYPLNPESEAETLLDEKCIALLASSAGSLFLKTLGVRRPLLHPAMREYGAVQPTLKGMTVAKLGNRLGIRSEVTDYSPMHLKAKILALLPESSLSPEGWAKVRLSRYAEARKLGEEVGAAICWQAIAEIPNAVKIDTVSSLLSDLPIELLLHSLQGKIEPYAMDEFTPIFSSILKGVHAGQQKGMTLLNFLEEEL